MRYRTALLVLPPLVVSARARPPDIQIQDNPTPQQRYEVTLQIRQSPDPFNDAARGWTRYRIGDDRWLPLTRFEDATLHPI